MRMVSQSSSYTKCSKCAPSSSTSLNYSTNLVLTLSSLVLNDLTQLTCLSENGEGSGSMLAWLFGMVLGPAPVEGARERPPGKGSEPFEDVRLVTEGRKATVDDRNDFCFAWARALMNTYQLTRSDFYI